MQLSVQTAEFGSDGNVQRFVTQGWLRWWSLYEVCKCRPGDPKETQRG